MNSLSSLRFYLLWLIEVLEVLEENCRERFHELEEDDRKSEERFLLAETAIQERKQQELKQLRHEQELLRSRLFSPVSLDRSDFEDSE